MIHSHVIASVDQFAEAQRTVEHLRASGIDRTSLDIVGADLRLADRTHAGSVWRSTRTAALYGATAGLLLAVFITLVVETTLTAFAVLFWGFGYGVLLGALGGFFRGLIRNRPDGESAEIVPTRYEVRCIEQDASVAKALLVNTRQPSAHSPTTANPHLQNLTDAA